MFHSKLLWWPQHMEDIITEVPKRCHLLPRKREIRGEVEEET